MSKRRSEAIVNEQLDLRIFFRNDSTGALFDPVLISKVEILDSDASTILETITSTTKYSIGDYGVVTLASWNTTSRLIYDKWYFTIVSGGTIYTSIEDTFVRTVTPTVTDTTFTLDVMITNLRIRVKDTHPNTAKRKFTDLELQAFIENALWDINGAPPGQTAFLTDNWYAEIPQWKNLILDGAVIFSLIAQGVFEIGKEFTYSDNGISVGIERSGKYSSLMTALLATYEAKKLLFKKNYWMSHLSPEILLTPELIGKIRTYSPHQTRIR